MRRTKEQRGITLIALIITIVVLLILAVVAINSIQNDGILGHAQNAAGTYNQAVKNEQSMLQEYEDYLTGINGGFDAYTVGQEVKVVDKEGVEHAFYVIKDSAKTESKVLLFAKGNINTTTLKQENANTIAFSSTVYWADADSYAYYELTEIGIPDANHYAAYAAYQYGLKLGGIGRLMSYYETRNMSSSIILGDVPWENSYWIGAASDHNNGLGEPKDWMVLAIYNDDDVENCYKYSISDKCGVRPVVEISKSKVTPVTVAE